MINTRKKMYWVNAKIKKKLKELGYSNIYLFPHLRFQKDYVVDGVRFDGIATINDSVLLFQNKSNRRPTKKELLQLMEVAIKYNCQTFWFVYKDRMGVEVFR